MGRAVRPADGGRLRGPGRDRAQHRGRPADQAVPHEAKAIAVKPTENLQAYDCYLRARSFARRVTRTDLEFALQMYERAIELDPGFAVAYAGLANVCGLYFEWHEREARWIEKGLAASERALELSPNLPEALSARARIFYAQKDYEKAARLAEQAVALKPDCDGAYYMLGRAYFASDKWEQAAAIAGRAVEASGDDYNVYIPFVNALSRLGRAEGAAELRGMQQQTLSPAPGNRPRGRARADPAREPVRQHGGQGPGRAGDPPGARAAARRHEHPLQRRVRVRRPRGEGGGPRPPAAAQAGGDPQRGLGAARTPTWRACTRTPTSSPSSAAAPDSGGCCATPSRPPLATRE